MGSLRRLLVPIRRASAPAALVALALLIFLPLLRSPQAFPAGGPPGSAARAIADATVRARWERATGEISQLDPDLGGRNRAGDPAAFYTHAVYYLLSRVLPGGLSLTLVAALHLVVLGLGTWGLAGRLGFGRGAALFSGAVAVACGGAASGLASPEGMGGAAAAALSPAAALLAAGIRRKPTLPRTAALAILVALMGLGGDLAALALAAILAAAGVALLERQAGREEERRPARRLSTAALACGALLGLALASYRALPLLLADPARALGLTGFARGPWWQGSAGHVRLPFFVGAITLVAVAAGLAARPRDRRVVLLAMAALLLALASPPAFLPFVGLPLALAAAAGAERLSLLVPVRAGAGPLLFGVLLIEALAHHGPRIPSRSAEEIAAAPLWARFLASAGGAERTAILGTDGDRFAAALASRGVVRAGVGPVRDLGAVEDPRALWVLGARTIVSDLPDPRKRFPLIRFDRLAGKYIYLNTSRLGPAYWTQRVEIQGEGSGEPAVAPGLVVPRQTGAAALRASDGASDPAGDSYGVVRAVERLPSGVRCAVRLPGEAYLVIAEPFLPGMLARVDGREVPLLAANGSQLALRLPAGRHDVRISYRPPGLAEGAALSTLALAALPLLLVAPVLSALATRSRRARRREPLTLPPIPDRARRQPAAAAQRS